MLEEAPWSQFGPQSDYLDGHVGLDGIYLVGRKPFSNTDVS